MPEEPRHLEPPADRHAAAERRRDPRYVANPETPWHLVANLMDSDVPVRIEDISLGGLCLVAGRRFEEGNLLAIELLNLVSDVHYAVVLRVLYVKERSSGDYFVGGTFLERLENSALKALLT